MSVEEVVSRHEDEYAEMLAEDLEGVPQQQNTGSIDNSKSKQAGHEGSKPCCG